MYDSLCQWVHLSLHQVHGNRGPQVGRRDDRRSWGSLEIRFRLRRVDPGLVEALADAGAGCARIVPGAARRPCPRSSAARRGSSGPGRNGRPPGSSCRFPSGDARCCTSRRSVWQNPRPSWRDPKRSGKSGRYFRVLNWASEYGLSLEVCGRDSDLVTPRSASSRATGVLVIDGPAVGMRGELSRIDSLPAAGLRDELLGQGGALLRGQQPAGHVAAEDVQEHVEVVVGPLHRAEQLGDVPGPHLVRSGRQQFGLLVHRVAQLVPPLPHFRVRLRGSGTKSVPSTDSGLHPGAGCRPAPGRDRRTAARAAPPGRAPAPRPRALAVGCAVRLAPAAGAGGGRSWTGPAPAPRRSGPRRGAP